MQQYGWSKPNQRGAADALSLRPRTQARAHVSASTHCHLPSAHHGPPLQQRVRDVARKRRQHRYHPQLETSRQDLPLQPSRRGASPGASAVRAPVAEDLPVSA